MDRTLTGDELLHLCTGRGLNVTALWNRMYRTETLRRAFTYADDFYCIAGEDLYLSFCIGLSARSFRGAVTEPLYTYRKGLGMCGSSKFGAEELRKWCTMVQLPRRMEATLRQRGLWDRYGDDCRSLALRIALDCCCEHFSRVRPEERTAALDILEDAFGAALSERPMRDALIRDYVAQEDWAQELYAAKLWLMEQVKVRDARIAELENWIAELQQGKDWLESQYRSQAARLRELEGRPARPGQRRGLFRRGKD